MLNIGSLSMEKRLFSTHGLTVLFIFLQVTVKTLPFYHKYFNIAYPLPKMDLIALADFAAGINSVLKSSTTSANS